MVDLLHKHRYGQFEKPIRLLPEIPPDLDAILCQLLEKDPAKRPADGAVLARQLERVRRKETSKTILDVGQLKHDPGPGPATFASQVVRAELERVKLGGRWRQIFNNFWLVLLLFLLTAGILVWSLWPLSPETRFQRGSALMASSNSDDWDRAWSEYLEPLRHRIPTFGLRKYRPSCGNMNHTSANGGPKEPCARRADVGVAMVLFLGLASLAARRARGSSTHLGTSDRCIRRVSQRTALDQENAGPDKRAGPQRRARSGVGRA